MRSVDESSERVDISARSRGHAVYPAGQSGSSAIHARLQPHARTAEFGQHQDDAAGHSAAAGGSGTEQKMTEQCTRQRWPVIAAVIERRLGKDKLYSGATKEIEMNGIRCCLNGRRCHEFVN